jgi:hypothetical protein
MERSAFKMGVYGNGTLWCLKEREGTYITFNGLRIARRERNGTWWPLENGWKVDTVGPATVRVRYNENAGMVLAFRGGSSGYNAAPLK